jgi:hypothetical protein
VESLDARVANHSQQREGAEHRWKNTRDYSPATHEPLPCRQLDAWLKCDCEASGDPISTAICPRIVA